MNSVQDLKQDLIDYLMSMDKSKMSMTDLDGYIFAVKSVLDMDKPNPFEAAYAALQNHGINPTKEGAEQNA